MPLTDEELRQTRSDRNLGQFMGLSGNKVVRDLGRSQTKTAESRIDESKKYRPRVSLGKGVYFDPATGESGIDDNYQTQVTAEQDYKDKFQAQKDAEALKRSQLTQLNKLTSIPASERKGHRVSQLAVSMLPDIISQVKANPDAFGAGADMNKYAPDWMPNMVTEGVKNYQQQNRTPAQQQARASVIENASAIIKQLSGAAVSTQESARIEGFLPAPNDSAEVILNKLEEAKRTAQLRLDSYAVEYPSLQGQQYQNAPQGATQEGSDGGRTVVKTKTIGSDTYRLYSDGKWEKI